VLSTLNTSRSAGAAASWLRSTRPAELFLELPPACEDYLREAEPGALELMVEDGLLTPEEAQGIKLAPLLSTARELGCRVHCYLDPLHQLARREFVQELVLLSLRAKVSGRIRVQEWRRAAERLIEAEEKASRREAEYILRRCSGRSACTNLSESACRVLESLGFRVRRHVLAEASRPVDLLLRAVRLERRSGRLRDEELESCVKAHLRFLEMVEELGYEEAVLRLSSQPDASA